ncbi:MAG: hypothetical protein AAB731_04300, partial [Patescibacteria group bacterium]
MKYFLILGKNKNLSLAEAMSLLSRRLRKVEFLYWDSFLIFETSSTSSPSARGSNPPVDDSKKELLKELWNEFGGAIKFGEIIGEVKNITDLNAGIFTPHLDKEKKNFFGISFYTSPPPLGRGRRGGVDIFKLGMTLKRQFESADIKIRLVTSKEETLSSVVVKTNKLLTRGMEAVILDAGDKLFIGKTLAVQEFADYEFRDYGRPGRDPLSGMIPPKLAKMMLNLSGAEKDSVILDPFCGSGTIITEA